MKSRWPIFFQREKFTFLIFLALSVSSAAHYVLYKCDHFIVLVSSLSVYIDVGTGDLERKEDKVLPISQGLDAVLDLELTLRGYVFLEI